VLGFTPTFKSSEYAIVERRWPTINFQKAASEEVMQCVREHTEIYIEVFWHSCFVGACEELQKPIQIRDLFHREYGMTEFHIGDPNGCLVFVGGTHFQAN